MACIERERGLDYDKYTFKYKYFSIKKQSNVTSGIPLKIAMGCSSNYEGVPVMIRHVCHRCGMYPRHVLDHEAYTLLVMIFCFWFFTSIFLLFPFWTLHPCNHNTSLFVVNPIVKYNHRNKKEGLSW